MPSKLTVNNVTALFNQIYFNNMNIFLHSNWFKQSKTAPILTFLIYNPIKYLLWFRNRHNLLLLVEHLFIIKRCIEYYFIQTTELQ